MNKVNMLTHTYPHKPLRKIEVAIYYHQVDSSLYVCPDVCPGDLQAKKRIWPYITLAGVIGVVVSSLALPLSDLGSVPGLGIQAVQIHA